MIEDCAEFQIDYSAIYAHLETKKHTNCKLLSHYYIIDFIHSPLHNYISILIS